MNLRRTIPAKLGALAASAALGLSMLPSARAGSATYDFETDPSNVLNLFGSAAWSQSGGNPGGYLLITPSQGSQSGTIIFKDFDNGLVVNAFTFSCDLMIGDGSDSPADGFSVNFARENDPVLLNQDGTGFSGIDGGSNMPEEGTTTGLAIGFDAYQNGVLATDNGLPDGDVHYDVIGISVRVDNQLVFEKPMRILNGASNNVSSIQTGPRDLNNPGSGSLLTWQPCKVELTDDGKVNIWWKGVQVVTNLQTAYFPSRGRLVFSGRTGASYEIQAVDNIKITTVAAAKPSVSAALLDAFGLTVKLMDAGSITVNTNTIVLKFDAKTVTPTSLTKAADVTTIVYKSPTLLPSGAVYPMEISFSDSSGQTSDISRDLTVAAYGLIPPSFAVPAANVDKSASGFRIRPHQVAAGEPNTIVWAEEQLAGLHGPNLADLSGADSTGFYNRTSVIGFNNASVTANFAADTPFSDVGIPGPTLSSEDNSAMEILTYLELPAAGAYTLGVNHDDGFRLTTSANPLDKLALQLATDNGTSPVTFSLVVTEPGIYPFRMVWENGGGGALLEWYAIDAQGQTNLINEPSAPGAIKAYRTASSLPAYVSSVTPGSVETQAPANSDIIVAITDGAKPLDATSVLLNLNGQVASVTTTKSGNVSTVKAASTALLPAGSTNSVTLTYRDTATPPHATTNQWSFQVAPVQNLLTDLVSPVGSGDNSAPGFKARIYQADQVGTTEVIEQITFFEQVLAGIVSPNMANLAGATAGWFNVDGAINWNTDTAAPAGNFPSDTAVPGMPGTVSAPYQSSNIAGEILTYVEFPTAGYYALGVNSDDGFRLTFSTNAPASNGALLINSPASAKGSYYAVTAGRNQTGGIGLDITNAITGKLVYADPPIADTPLNNAAAIKGNIALIDRGTVTFATKLDAARAAGAIAVVLANNRATDAAEGIYPIVLGGNPSDIPAVMISLPDGDKIRAVLSQGVNVTLTVPAYDSSSFQYDGTRGPADSITGINVPKAGVYPVRCVWMNCGGAGALELFSMNSDGTKVLLNDRSNPKALKAYRARTFTPPTGPTLSYTVSGSNLTLTFTGSLESSATVDGKYVDTGKTSPAVIAISSGTQFYRVRGN